MNAIDLLQTTRENILKTVAPFSLEQLNKIPEGHTNNLAWQLGHILVTQQLLCYKLAGCEPLISQDIIDKYRKGTQSDVTISQEEIDWIKEQLMSTIDAFRVDFAQGKFAQYNSYSTSYNVTLESIEDAIQFNNVHEALHFGSIMSMRKLV